jgi:hypothetical protein
MKKLIIATLMLMLTISASAQCTFRNTAVKNGEFISYNLYYNWKFIWVKAGTASMSSVETNYKGKRALRTSLITRGNGRLDDFFVLRDTLLAYSGVDMAPLYYRKGAREGKRYTVDEAFYTYPNGNINVKLHRQKNDGTHVWATKSPDQCVFDMVNIFQRARSFNPSNWKEGYEVNFKITDGIKILDAKIKYSGRATVKGDNGKKYNCLKLSYIENDDGKYKEIARFFVTDDTRHVPVRLDMFLKFGSAKAFLTNIK